MKYYEVFFSIKAPAELMGDACDMVAALAGETGFETFEETEGGLKGYVQQTLFSEPELQQVLGNFPFEGVSVTFSAKEAEDKDWNEQWEQEGFEPIVVDGKCVIHDGRHMLSPAEAECLTGAKQIEIDAKLAFGTGNHETTRMIVSTLLGMDLHNKTVLDCGCGTGILGIVALSCGASHCTGYDIDEWSADNARHNAVINRVDDRFTALLGDATLLDDIAERFDIVMANINRNILLADMPRFRQHMKEGGLLILSGFYTSDVALLQEKAEALGLHASATLSDHDWACLVLS